MGLFEKALAFQKEKRGLYHKLIEFRKKLEEEPKSLYLKAKKFRELFNEKIDLPRYKIDDQKTKQDPELLELQPPKVDIFEEWEKEIHQELSQKSKDETLPSRILEEEEEVLTLPEEIHIAGQKRIDYYLSLFDFAEELQELENYEEVLEIISFSIQEQLGTRSILVFGNQNVFKENQPSFSSIIQVGYEEISLELNYDDDFIKECKSVPQAQGEIFYLNSLKKKLNTLQTKLKDFQNIFNDFVIYFPLMDVMDAERRIFAIFFISNPLDRNDYILDDLEFLRILIKLSVSKLKQLQKNFEFYEYVQETKAFNEYTKNLLEFTTEITSFKNLDQVFDAIQSFLETNFSVSMFSFILLDTDQNSYKLFSGKNISLTSLQKFDLSFQSDLVNLVSNLNQVYDLKDFKNHQDVIDNYSEEDIALMESFLIVPIIHQNWLIGMLIIHKFSRTQNQNQFSWLLYFATFIAPVISNLLFFKERDLVLKDTFSPIKSLLEKEIQKSDELQIPITIVDFKIKNIKRLMAVNEVKKLEEILNKFINTIRKSLNKQSFFSRLSSSRLIILLENHTQKDAQMFLRKLITTIKEENVFLESPIEPIFTYEIYTYPTDVDNIKKILALLDI
ncbi:MAG: GAF domain-containing protein [Leptospiraceae bacterium]|nr:GAF domain-containing protein [Leptospiraceae bacterium]MDW7977044.1 GAF domain-containing protein [Leptospiraceae bacterium]